MKTGEKIRLKGKAEIIRPCGQDHLDINLSIQTHYLPDVGKPDPPVKSPVIKTSDVS